VDNFEVMTVEEVAALLKCKPGFIHEKTRARADNPIPHFRMGRYLRFSRIAVLEWLQSTATPCKKAGSR